MALLRSWILGVTAAAMAVAAAQALMPEGAVKRAGRLTGGLVLALALLQPVLGAGTAGLPDTLPGASLRTGNGETGEQMLYASMKEVIEERVAAYITEKGTDPGTAAVRVTCREGGGGVPVPWQVEVTGSLTDSQRAELEQWLTSEIGIPGERQHYGGKRVE